MDTRKYIESGILERYVLSDVSDQEAREVQCLSSIYPELHQELEALNESLATYASVYAMEAPATLRDSILAAIDSEFQDRHPDGSALVQGAGIGLAQSGTAPAAAIADATSGAGSDRTTPETPVRTLPSAAQRSGRMGWAVAASLALFLAAAALWWTNRSELENVKDQYAQTEQALQETRSQLEAARGEVALDDEYLAIVTDPSTVRVPLGLLDNPFLENATVAVYYHAAGQHVMLDIDALPPPPDDHDYQVWAIVDGKPVDLGVLNSDLGIHRMKSISEATAFTVTIETLGGNPVPTLDRMVLRGAV